MKTEIRGAVIEDFDQMQEIVGRILERGGLVVVGSYLIKNFWRE